MMSHFYIYTLADGRRALVDSLAGAGSYYDFMTGFGRAVRILP